MVKGHERRKPTRMTGREDPPVVGQSPRVDLTRRWFAARPLDTQAERVAAGR